MHVWEQSCCSELGELGGSQSSRTPRASSGSRSQRLQLLPRPFPSILHRETALGWLHHKNRFVFLFLNSFYVVNGIVFTAFYYFFLFFFFRISQFSKNLISPLSTTTKRKHLYRKRTRKKFVALALLPKIERIRVTKTPQRKRRAREPVAPPSPCPASPPSHARLRSPCGRGSCHHLSIL